MQVPRGASEYSVAVAAVIVNWNGRRFLPRCLAALAGSTLPVRVLVVDNASTDGSLDYLRAEHPEVTILALPENRGYAGGANAGIRATSAEFVMIMNPDVILAPDHLEILLARLAEDPSIGAAQGKLFQIRPGDYLDGRLDAATRLDSAGHAVRRTRMVVDIGQGEPDSAEYDRERSVFSACGAALLLRRRMLEDVAPGGECFDESFFAYKEDIDLCWRARLLGWDIRYIPQARGYHARGWAGTKPPPPHSLPPLARYHSWKNHYLLVLKNDFAGSALTAFPALLGWEAVRQGHAVLRDRSVYRAYRELIRLVPGALAKRKEVMDRRRVTAGEMRRWFGAKRGLPPQAGKVTAPDPAPGASAAPNA